MGEAEDFDVDAEVVGQAATAASALAEQVAQGGDAVAWQALDAGLKHYEQETGGTADELLPEDTPRLAFAGIDRAREFAGKLLCNQKEKLRATVEAGIGGGMAALVSALFAVLALPVVAAPVVIAMAAVLMVRGVDGFCQSAHGA
jgi:hypothetical protein